MAITQEEITANKRKAAKAMHAKYSGTYITSAARSKWYTNFTTDEERSAHYKALSKSRWDQYYKNHPEKQDRRKKESA
jgi:hypothetical protein